MSRSKPCEPMDEPCTSRTVPLAGWVTERFSARNSFLPFDVVQCSWLGCRVVVTVLMKLTTLVGRLIFAAFPQSEGAPYHIGGVRKARIADQTMADLSRPWPSGSAPATARTRR